MAKHIRRSVVPIYLIGLSWLVNACDKQLNALFGEAAMDISTDITVLENLLRQQGFASGEKTNSEDGSITLEL